MKTTVEVPDDLYRRAKAEAALRGRKLKDLIEEGLRLVVSDNAKKATPKRVLPRYSDAVGGPLPGIDISDSAALQEMEDLEYVERMKHFK